MDISSSRTIGIDIGGANLKLADDLGNCRWQSFPLWKSPNALAEQITELLKEFPTHPPVVITMTGELADCFANRDEGVRSIVASCASTLGSRCSFYGIDGKLRTAAEAIEQPFTCASSNWHAMANFAGCFFQGTGLLIDIGSTTSDFIAIDQGKVITTSSSDFDRLHRGELIYIGVGRTPVCSIIEALPFEDAMIPVMNEVFATTDDCAIIAGMIEEVPSDYDTCDGRPRTKVAAHRRLARMIGLDCERIDAESSLRMAMHVLLKVQARLTVTAEILSAPDATWILSGHGGWLLDIPADRKCIDLNTALSPALSRVGPAYALARLALEYFNIDEAVPSTLQP